MKNDEQLEQQIQDKNLEAPRITLDHVKGMMDRVSFTFYREPNTTATFCHAFLDNEFFLVTGFSACVSPENFDAELGKDAAYKDAYGKSIQKLYELEGYKLWSNEKLRAQFERENPILAEQWRTLSEYVGS